MAEVLCGECSAPMILRTGKFGQFYGCSTYPACGGTHGAHPDGSPMGIPADGPTKAARVRAHEAFDRLWQEGHVTSRKAAYRWLQATMQLSKEEAHISRFTAAQCDRLIEHVEAFIIWRTTGEKSGEHPRPFGTASVNSGVLIGDQQ